jgi:hypothetical protein
VLGEIFIPLEAYQPEVEREHRKELGTRAACLKLFPKTRQRKLCRQSSRRRGQERTGETEHFKNDGETEHTAKL